MRVKIFCDDGSVVDYFLTKTTTARQLSEEIAKIKCAQSPKAMANVLSVTISQGKGKSVAYISPDVVLDEAVSSIVKGQEEQINGKSKMNGVDNYISGDIKISVLGLKTMDAQQKLQTIKELTLQLKAIGGRLEHAVYNLNGEGKVMDVDVNPVTSKFEDVSEAPVQSAVAAAPTAVLALPSTGMRTNKSIISEIERKIAAFIKEILESVDQLDKRGKHSIFAAKVALREGNLSKLSKALRINSLFESVDASTTISKDNGSSSAVVNSKGTAPQTQKNNEKIVPAKQALPKPTATPAAKPATTPAVKPASTPAAKPASTPAVKSAAKSVQQPAKLSQITGIATSASLSEDAAAPESFTTSKKIVTSQVKPQLNVQNAAQSKNSKPTNPRSDSNSSGSDSSSSGSNSSSGSDSESSVSDKEAPASSTQSKSSNHTTQSDTSELKSSPLKPMKVESGNSSNRASDNISSQHHIDDASSSDSDGDEASDSSKEDVNRSNVAHSSKYDVKNLSKTSKLQEPGTLSTKLDKEQVGSKQSAKQHTSAADSDDSEDSSSDGDDTEVSTQPQEPTKMPAGLKALLIAPLAQKSPSHFLPPPTTKPKSTAAGLISTTGNFPTDDDDSSEGNESSSGGESSSDDDNVDDNDKAASPKKEIVDNDQEDAMVSEMKGDGSYFEEEEEEEKSEASEDEKLLANTQISNDSTPASSPVVKKKSNRPTKEISEVSKISKASKPAVVQKGKKPAAVQVNQKKSSGSEATQAATVNTSSMRSQSAPKAAQKIAVKSNTSNEDKKRKLISPMATRNTRTKAK